MDRQIDRERERERERCFPLSIEIDTLMSMKRVNMPPLCRWPLNTQLLQCPSLSIMLCKWVRVLIIPNKNENEGEFKKNENYIVSSPLQLVKEKNHPNWLFGELCK